MFFLGKQTFYCWLAKGRGCKFDTMLRVNVGQARAAFLPTVSLLAPVNGQFR
jgi:hypothetical protein